MQTSQIPILHLSGPPYERGLAHGEALGDIIAKSCAFLQSEFRHQAESDAAAYALRRDFIETSAFETAIEKNTPELLEEIEGIAAGAKLETDDILLLNLGDEIWSFMTRQRREIRGGKCTAFGVRRSERASWAGQNMDVGTSLEGTQVLLHISSGDAEPDSYIFSSAGLIGLTGMNTSPLSVCCNSLLTLTAGNHGLPVAFVLRRLLMCASLAEAADVIRALPHASGQNYLIADPTGARSFECSTDSVAECVPAKCDSYIAHTNHPLSSSDTNDYKVTASSRSSSYERLASIYARLQNAPAPISLNALKEALAARDNPEFPVSRTGNYSNDSIGYTLGSLIYDLSETPRLHIAGGPPCCTDWLAVDCDGRQQDKSPDASELGLLGGLS